jgi:hypothetical protein
MYSALLHFHDRKSFTLVKYYKVHVLDHCGMLKKISHFKKTEKDAEKQQDQVI